MKNDSNRICISESENFHREAKIKQREDTKKLLTKLDKNPHMKEGVTSFFTFYNFLEIL